VIPSIMDGADARILATTKELCLRLGIADFVNEVWWDDLVDYRTVKIGEPRAGHRGVSTVPAYQPMFRGHQLLLAKRMWGIISPDDWKPLIAASLVFHKILAPKLRRKTVEDVLIPFVFFIGSLLTAGIIQSLWLAFVGLIGGPALVFFGIYRYLKNQVKLQLEADLLAAKTLADASLLDVLSKIQSLSLKDEAGGGVAKIDLRLENLQRNSLNF
jgi:hypothetical protein